MAIGAQVFRVSNRAMNAAVKPLLRSPLHGLVDRYLASITYTGRRSGRTFTTPVAYRAKGSEVRIAVAMPEVKTWWRNFEGDGGPLHIRFAGSDHAGHAVAKRTRGGGTEVVVTLAD